MRGPASFAKKCLNKNWLKICCGPGADSGLPCEDAKAVSDTRHATVDPETSQHYAFILRFRFCLRLKCYL